MTGIPHSLIDDLASELGAIVARIERELRQRFDALSAELRAKTAEMELRAVTAERATADMVSARMATLRNGEDGQPGTSITVEDVAPLIAAEVAKAVAADAGVEDRALLAGASHKRVGQGIGHGKPHVLLPPSRGQTRQAARSLASPSRDVVA